jgi:alkanesulfonate monooxygenase SsuD/methylene tetrahydromethanopterin reductase-like flavin-dependent oxidoreductase (luciferase family)
MIDFLSEGRLILGLGAGYHPADYDQIGVPLSDRGSRMEEAITVIRNVWSDSPSVHSGRHYRLGTTNPLIHRTFNRGGPPIWMGTGSRVGIKRAARLANGLVLGSVASFERVGEDVARYRELCAEVGTERGTVAVMRRAWIGNQSEVDGFVKTMQLEYARHSRSAGATGPKSTQDLQGLDITPQVVRDRVLVGEEREIRDRAVEFCSGAGIDYLILKFQWGQPDFAQIQEQLRRSRSLLSQLDAISA